MGFRCSNLGDSPSQTPFYLTSLSSPCVSHACDVIAACMFRQDFAFDAADPPVVPSTRYSHAAAVDLPRSRMLVSA